VVVVRPLLVCAVQPTDELSVAIMQSALRGLQQAGRHVDTIDLYADGFRAAMSHDERVAYETDHPILDPVVEQHARLLAAADALIFLYPSTGLGLPAVMKGWVERVMVPGVAFSIDPDTRRVAAGLGQLRRLVGISTYQAPHWRVALAGDGGRRLITRCLRMMNPRVGRVTRWCGLYGIAASDQARRTAFLGDVERAMERL
jgi:NAD(P)H dehydrogenase (quinone)